MLRISSVRWIPFEDSRTPFRNTMFSTRLISSLFIFCNKILFFVFVFSCLLLMIRTGRQREIKFGNRKKRYEIISEYKNTPIRNRAFNRSWFFFLLKQHYSLFFFIFAIFWCVRKFKSIFYIRKTRGHWNGFVLFLSLLK